MSNQPVVTAENYERWRASSFGQITEKVETDLIFALAYALAAASRGAVVTALDPLLTRFRTPGAAFLVVAADRPEDQS